VDGELHPLTSGQEAVVVDEFLTLVTETLLANVSEYVVRWRRSQGFHPVVSTNFVEAQGPARVLGRLLELKLPFQEAKRLTPSGASSDPAITDGVGAPLRCYGPPAKKKVSLPEFKGGDRAAGESLFRPHAPHPRG
jgi:hypothetical protein